MASMICISCRTQQSYSSLDDVEWAIHTLPKYHKVDIDFPIIAKGNIIEGIEAKV